MYNTRSTINKWEKKLQAFGPALYNPLPERPIFFIGNVQQSDTFRALYNEHNLILSDAFYHFIFS